MQNIDPSTLVDIKSIQIDTSSPIAERMQQYLSQIKNPHHFLCGATPVTIRFADTGATLDQAVKNHFLGLKQ